MNKFKKSKEIKKIKKIHFMLFFIAFIIFIFLSFQNEEDILKKLDENVTFESIHYTGTLEIIRNNNKIIKTFECWAKNDLFLIIFKNPEDNGVKYLKKDGNLYVYFPSADDVLTISKSMMKQGFMGSDISNEDITRNRKLLDDYSIVSFNKIIEKDNIFYELTLQAKTKDVPYFMQKLIINSDFVAIKTEQYDLAKRLVKTIIVDEIKKFGSRYYPVKVTIQDGIKTSYKTIFSITDVSFNIPIDPKIFTIQNLYNK
ncbi:MAG: outer membrane lipoprotein-sorting protein [Spirochaetales bacterium]|jgi:hypothetical protein|nr:outer membrane lipoprotein-sorting protein [Exilispira sp.]NMC67798.1 outer membrane lipoprotein-sorting protein [Spirochaetales bacterium]